MSQASRDTAMAELRAQQRRHGLGPADQYVAEEKAALRDFVEKVALIIAPKEGKPGTKERITETPASLLQSYVEFEVAVDAAAEHTLRAEQHAHLRRVLDPAEQHGEERDASLEVMQLADALRALAE